MFNDAPGGGGFGGLMIFVVVVCVISIAVMTLIVFGIYRSSKKLIQKPSSSSPLDVVLIIIGILVFLRLLYPFVHDAFLI